MNSGQMDIATARKAKYDVPSWEGLKRVSGAHNETLVRDVTPFLMAFAKNNLAPSMGKTKTLREALDKRGQWTVEVEADVDQLVAELKRAGVGAFREGRDKLAGSDLQQEGDIAKKLALHQAQLIFCSFLCDIHSFALKINGKMQEGARLEDLKASIDRLWKFVELLAGQNEKYPELVEKLLKTKGSERFVEWLGQEKLL